ncbi:MAG: hypothetical protein LBL13_10380 [Bacteroidales bacterium]|jgi:hypothetical protein|nr:hypothetical protein [Bacteroidales bacterium]
MDEKEKINLQQEISSLKEQQTEQARQQNVLLEQLTKVCDLIKELAEILVIETKQNIITACQQSIKQLRQKK